MKVSVWSREYRGLSLGIVALVSVFGFEGIGAGTIMPIAAKELNALAQYSVAFTSFTLASVLGMVLATSFAARFGLARVVTLTMLFLGAGSLIAGSAPNLEVFVIGRAIQGLAIGMDLVTMYVIIGRAYPMSHRPKAFAILAGAWVVPGLLGPGVAGAMAEYLSWRWVFWIVPLVLLLPMTLLVPRVRALPAGPEMDQAPTRPVFLAALLAIFGLALLQFASSQAGTQTAIYVFGLGLLALIAIAVSTRWLMPAGFLKIAPGVAAIVAIRGIFAAAYFSAEAFLPLALQHERGVSATMSGAVLAAASVFWFTGSSIQSSHRIKLKRENLVRFGGLIVMSSIALLPLAVFRISDPTTAAWAATAIWALVALGMGMTFPVLGVLLLDKSPESSHAKDSASIQMSDSFGVAMATAIGGGVIAYAQIDGSLGATAFTTIWLIASGYALVAVLTAARVR